MPSEADQSRKSAFLAFWTTLPGILTGLAALITAIVGAVALWQTQSGGGNSSPTSPVRSVTLSATVGGGTGRGPGASSRFFATGRLSLARGDSADLEREQIGESADADVSFGPESTPTLHAGASSFLAPVDKRPTKPACIAALRRRHDSLELVSRIERKWTCVATTEGNVGVLRIASASGVGFAEVVLDYVVWR
jgi:hypothetical protein